MEAISMMLTLLLLVVGGFYLHAVRKPNHKLYVKHFSKGQTRQSMHKKFLPVLLVIFVLIGITAPPSSADQQPLAPSSDSTSESKPQEKAPAPVTREIAETTGIPFGTETQEDSSLPSGQTSIAQEGKNGEKITIYEVTYLNGKEAGRTVKGYSVTLKPVSKIINKGTYVAPTYTAPSSGDGYTNVDGNHVDSPSSNPAGATAQCSDGTYSYSQHHSGTCSHHGGVAVWL